MSAILKACITTVIVETAYWRLLGRRSAYEMTIVALANVVTNLSLNLFISIVNEAYYFPWILMLEGLVVMAEYLIFRIAFGDSKHLLIRTFTANVITYSLGLLMTALGLL